MLTLVCQLTTIKNLLGRQGGHFLIFGLLTRMEDGEFYLEDLDDKVKLDLSEAVRAFLPTDEMFRLTRPLSQTPESGLFTEGSFVLIDGDYTLDSIFKVAEIGHPPSERRDEAMFVLKSPCLGSRADALKHSFAGRFTDITTSWALERCPLAKR